MFLLRQLSRYYPPNILKMAYYGLANPHMKYGSIQWGSWSTNKLNTIFVLQKPIMREVSKL